MRPLIMKCRLGMTSLSVTAPVRPAGLEWFVGSASYSWAGMYICPVTINNHMLIINWTLLLSEHDIQPKKTITYSKLQKQIQKLSG